MQDIIIFFVILSVMMLIILPKELGNYDELWNYNFARNIANGRLPYRDFNMVQMPLLSLICGLFLKTFGNQLIVMRVLAVLLNTAIFYLVYKILEKLNINKSVCYIGTIAIFYLIKEYLLCMDYNFAVLLICLILMYMEIKRLNKNDKALKPDKEYDLIIGLIAGISILIKQTTGIFIAFVTIFYKILLYSKGNWKNTVKIILYRALGVLIAITCLFVYFVINNIFNDFLNYTIFGIKTFNNNIPYINLILKEKIIIRILSCLMPITLIYLFVKVVIFREKNINNNKLLILFAYGMAHIIVVYPIADEAHFLIGGIPVFITIIYLFYLFLSSLIKNKEIIKKYIIEFTKAFSFLIVIAFLLSLIIENIHNRNNNLKTSNLNHFKYIPSYFDTDINYIDDYILDKEKDGKKVYILDASACMYMIPIDRYNNEYDMFLNGNLGAKGEEGQIEKIKQEDNLEILILNENFSRNWQNPEKVRKYIIENWNKIGEIKQFDVYSK